MTELKTIKDINIGEEEFVYNFQNELTKKLDNTNGDFSQEIINEIVLWKVNRYAILDNETLSLINSIDVKSNILDINLTSKLLERLLNTKGIKLAMASTILRFKNPNIYQIIDQRVFRFIYGEDMSLKGLKIEGIIKLYIDYLLKLKEICSINGIDYSESDRVLYALDKKLNKDFKIKY
ncbi:MAG: hypothetical protein PHH98_05100 [Candidatus Gracilibacteria bacterium]|nr:hypothetical protein [Candidatus Gracilibacteria bacterium]